MTPPMYLSRIELRRDNSIASLMPLLLGEGEHGGSQRSPGHHLLWSLFNDSTGRERDFLWREEGPGKFLALSARQPSDPHGLFSIETREFAPNLVRGDRLEFILRANPVRRRRKTQDGKPSKHDVVMDDLQVRGIGPADRAEARDEAIARVGRTWLEQQGKRNGFSLLNGIGIDGYRQHRIVRSGGDAPIRYSSVEMHGELQVDDPELLVSALARGFGASKAFGCGLMLIRRPFGY